MENTLSQVALGWMPSHREDTYSPERTALYTQLFSDIITQTLERHPTRPLVCRAALDTAQREAGTHGTERGHRVHLYRYTTPALTGAELCVVNSHNGDCKFRILAGWFEDGAEFTSDFEFCRIKHGGDTRSEDANEAGTNGEAIAAAIAAADNIAAPLSREVAGFKAFRITAQNALTFADMVNDIREKYGLKPCDRNALARRGYSPLPCTLWEAMKNCSRNCLEGGCPLALTGTEKRRRSTRAVRDISLRLPLEKEIWNAAREFARVCVSL